MIMSICARCGRDIAGDTGWTKCKECWNLKWETWKTWVHSEYHDTMTFHEFLVKSGYYDIGPLVDNDQPEDIYYVSIKSWKEGQ